MGLSPDSLVSFGAFELDVRTGELWKAGGRVSLPDQPFQVLKTLLERPGELVTRDELRQRLWSAETFVDFEHGLNAAVRRLRDALGDSADVPRYIETLPRRGYRFIAPVNRQPTASQIASSPSPAESESDVRPIPASNPTSGGLVARHRISVGIAASALVAAALLWGLSYRSAVPPESTPSTERFMMAVLPFENLTGQADQDYISDGMTEELIAQLGQMDPSRLGVIARTSAMQFKKTTRRANQIGADLGVDYLIEGSVRANGTHLRIAVQLIETEHETQLWAEQYERDAQNLLTLQREVAEAIARQLSASLGVAPSRVSADARRHSANEVAYEYYLRGRHFGAQDTADGLQKAVEQFQKAIDLDDSYALAYSGMADTYTLLGADGFLPMSEAYPLAKTAAQKALTLNDALGEAHGSMAAITADYYWDWAQAERHFKRAVALTPNYETALRWYSFYLACMKREKEALSFAERARRLAPVSWEVRMNLGVVLYFARRYPEAMSEIRKALELDPDFGPAHVMLGRIYLAQGLADRAVQELERAQAITGPRPDVVTPHAYALARAGRQRDAQTMLAGLQRSRFQAISPFRVAMVHIGLGDTNRAFAWLDKAVEARDWQVQLLNVEPAFDSIRADRRFARLVERVGLPQPTGSEPPK